MPDNEKSIDERPLKPYDLFFENLFRDLEPGEFPFRFTVEVTNHCNLRCVMCPRETSGRGYGNVDFELFESLARQAADKHVLFYPQGFGESFMHPRYREMLKMLNEVGVRHPVVITNATYLNEENAHAVIDASTPILIVSMDGADPEVFERNRVNANYDEVVANVKRFIEIREERGATYPHLILSVVGSDEVKATMTQFESLWNPLLRDHDEIYVCNVVTWAGSMPSLRDDAEKPDQTKRTPCRMLYKTLTVYHDGRATPCCYDHACELEVGNAKEQTVEEIWAGEPLKKLRDLHESGEFEKIPLCHQCPDFMP